MLYYIYEREEETTKIKKTIQEKLVKIRCSILQAFLCNALSEGTAVVVDGVDGVRNTGEPIRFIAR